MANIRLPINLSFNMFSNGNNMNKFVKELRKLTLSMKEVKSGF